MMKEQAAAHRSASAEPGWAAASASAASDPAAASPSASSDPAAAPSPPASAFAAAPAEDEAFERMKRECVEIFHRFKRGRYVPLSKPRDLTSSEAHAMMAIAHCRSRGIEPRPGAVARVADTTPSALSQTLKSLERKGYLVRERVGDDSRGVRLVLTDRGCQLAEEGERLRTEHMRALLAYIGKDDVEALIRIMKRISAFFEEEVRRGAMSFEEHKEGPCA